MFAQHCHYTHSSGIDITRAVYVKFQDRMADHGAERRYRIIAERPLHEMLRVVEFRSLSFRVFRAVQHLTRCTNLNVLLVICVGFLFGGDCHARAVRRLNIVM